MSDDQEYWVLFQAKVRGEHTEDGLRSSFKEMFDINDDSVAKVFSGQPTVIKPRADEMTAQQFKEKIEAFGGVCWFEPRANGAGYGERRNDETRRSQENRREQRRDHAILPDRRGSNGRRYEDQD